MNRFKLLWAVIGISAYSSFGLSARMKSFCTLAENNKEIVGQNIEERLPLASVSKLFTSLLVVSKNSVDRKIYTQFFMNPVQQNVYDVHIKGGQEPYFGRQALHWMIAKLNEAGVYKIRNLTFDEDFKYYHDPNKKIRVGKFFLDPVSGKTALEAPEPNIVQAQLMQNAEVMKLYAVSVKEAADNGVQLPKKIVFKPQKISFLHSSQFAETNQMKKGYVASPEILQMVKLMNWNSNNHAANQLFQLSGGLSEFQNLFYRKFGLQEKDVVFVNGSGQNANLDGDGRTYNEATCSTVVRTVKSLKKALEKQNVKLEDAVAVVGGDIGSTVGGKTYNNALTNLSVIAKTGTVGTNITLAGMISAKTGNHFFYFNVEINSAPKKAANKNSWNRAEANRARQIISTRLNELVKKLGGPAALDYKARGYDLENFEESEFEEEELVQLN